VPLYNALGNHDMTLCDLTPGDGQYGKALFEQYCGPRYQSFDWGDIHAVILDQWVIQPCNDGDSLLLTNDIDDTQLAWLRKDLASCQTGQTVMVFLHHLLMDYPDLFEKLTSAGILRDDLQYIEVAGCDHQNTFWELGENWQGFTTGSFCGGWWDGPCMDTAPAGYALMVRDETGRIKQYYRGLDQPLAVASPKPSQTICDFVLIDAIDPETGQRAEYEIESSNWKPGWNDIEIIVGENNQTLNVFRKPAKNQAVKTIDEVCFEFEIVEAAASPLVLQCNGVEIARLECPEVGICRFPIPLGGLCDWNIINITGDAVIRSPHLTLDNTDIQDPRIERLESLRPDWFGEGQALTWDITLRRPKTPWRHSENTFYFPVGDDI
jgi:hypothetical protein